MVCWGMVYDIAIPAFPIVPMYALFFLGKPFGATNRVSQASRNTGKGIVMVLRISESMVVNDIET